jgi:peptidoglycan DL-endopeptidase CwlO
MPALADPPAGSRITAVPDAGVRPVFNDLPALPTGTFAVPSTAPATARAALELQVTALTNEVSILEARRWTLQTEQSEAKLATTLADYAWRVAADELREARLAAEEAAKQAYLTAAELPPQVPIGPLRELDSLRPRLKPSRGVNDAAARELLRVQKTEQAALDDLNTAIATEQRANEALATLEALYSQRSNGLLELRKRLVDMQTLEERQRETAAQQLGVGYNAGKSNGGLVAHAKAQQAVMFAYSQRGKPYKWGDEGPNTYDCSGLMQTSYRNAGVSLNRVANDQYYGTRGKPVALSALLPGDLLFFATNPADWRTIHHVAMYIGDGKLIHAPSTGDVVRVANVNYSSVDFATRVVDAVPAPIVVTPTTPATSNSPSPSAGASQSTSPSPSNSPSTSPSSSPSSSSSSSPSPKPEPEPEPEPATSSSPSASPNP